MTFSEKLKKLRKESGLSQETFAEKLNVTRQAVSKWESGGAYPEMDKLLQMCKIFNCTLEELTNDEISNVNTKEDTAQKFKSYIDRFFNGINEGIDTIKAMNNDDIKRLVIEMIILLILINVIHYPINYLFNRAFYWGSGSALIFNSFFRFCYVLIEFAFFVLSVYLVIYIFKIRYMNKEVISKAKEEAPKEDAKKEKAKTIAEKKENKEVVKETVIVQNESVAKTILMGFVKFIMACILIPVTFTIVGYSIAVGVLVILAIEGIHLLGPIIILISLIIITSAISKFFWNLIINRNQRYTGFLSSIIIFSLFFGVGASITAYEATKYTFYNSVPGSNYKTSITKELDMNYASYDLIADIDLSDIRYEIDNTIENKVIITVNYFSEFISPRISINGNKVKIDYDLFEKGFSLNNKITDLVKLNLKEYKIYNYVKLYRMDIAIKGNSAAINSIKNRTNINYNYYD